MAWVLGVRVDDTRGHGTSLVATREFAPGDGLCFALAFVLRPLRPL